MYIPGIYLGVEVCTSCHRREACTEITVAFQGYRTDGHAMPAFFGRTGIALPPPPITGIRYVFPQKRAICLSVVGPKVLSKILLRAQSTKGVPGKGWRAYAAQAR